MLSKYNSIVKLKRRLSSSKILKNIFILTSGTTLAQVLGILASPILSRVFSTFEFGIFGSIMAIVSIVSTVSLLKYDMAIVVEEDERKLNALFLLCLTILILVSTFTCFLLLVVNEYASIQIFNGIDREYLLWILLIILVTGVANTMMSRLNRDEDYKSLALAQIIRRVGIVSIQIILGLLGIKVLGLVAGNFLGILTVSLFIIYLYRSKIKLFNSSIAEIKKVALKYKNFPLFIAPQTLINAAILHAPVLVLGAFHEVVVVGAYFFTLKIVQMPVGFIGQAVRRVFYREASLLYNNNKPVNGLFYKVTIGLVLLIVVPILVLAFFGPQLFSFFFGSEWELAGEFSRWMILWYGAIFIMSPSRALFLVFNKQKLILILDSLIGIIRILILIVLSLYFDPVIAIAGFSIASLIFYIMIVMGWSVYLKSSKL